MKKENLVTVSQIRSLEGLWNKNSTYGKLYLYRYKKYTEQKIGIERKKSHEIFYLR